jgi:hypothetical protein
METATELDDLLRENEQLLRLVWGLAERLRLCSEVLGKCAERNKVCVVCLKELTGEAQHRL